MRKTYRIELDEFDLGQLLDGLEVRAAAWKNTATYHRTGKSSAQFIVGERNAPAEADRIAAHYRFIIAKTRNQREAQS